MMADDDPFKGNPVALQAEHRYAEPGEPLPHGMPVSWKSKLGILYTGTVTAGPDHEDGYTVTTPSGGSALVPRADLSIAGDEPPPAAPEPEPEVDPVQAAAERDNRARLAAARVTTDAMQGLYSLMREDLRATLRAGEDLDRQAIDGLRVRAVDLIVEEAGKLQTAMREQVEDRATRGG